MSDTAAKNSSQLSFSKKDTLTVKGVAIILLVLYHCFSSSDRMFGYDVYLGPLPKESAYFIFESMNVCVGIFAFLSAFGLTKVAIKKYGDRITSFRCASEFNIKRTISLLGSFLIPYTLCTAVTLIFTDYNPYGEGIDFAFNMIADMLGIAGFIGSRMMIGTWWYMSFAIAIILLIPFTVAIYKKFGAACIMPYIVIPILISGSKFVSSSGLTNMTRWLLTIPLGVIFAQANTLERLRAFSPIKNRFISKAVKFIILTAALVGLVCLRKTPWCMDHFFYFISSVLPVFIVYYMYEFICPLPIVNTVLAFLGEHSSNIFFIHTFVRGVWWKGLFYSTENWFLIFLIVFGITLAISIAITYLQKLVRWNKLISFLSDKLTARFTKTSDTAET